MATSFIFDFAGVIMNRDAAGKVVLNHELLTFLKPLRDKHRLYIYTNSYEVLNETATHSAVSTLFSRVFFAKQLDWPKSEPESYLKIATELGVKPQELFFIDDLPDNVRAAQQAGVEATLYQSNHQVFEVLNQFAPGWS